MPAIPLPIITSDSRVLLKGHVAMQWWFWPCVGWQWAPARPVVSYRNKEILKAVPVRSGSVGDYLVTQFLPSFWFLRRFQQSFSTTFDDLELQLMCQQK
jgi:hypothetical protein